MRRPDITGGVCYIQISVFLDKTCAVVSDEGKEDLKGVLTDEEYQLLTDNKELKMKCFFFGD